MSRRTRDGGVAAKKRIDIDSISFLGFLPRSIYVPRNVPFVCDGERLVAWEPRLDAGSKKRREMRGLVLEFNGSK